MNLQAPAIIGGLYHGPAGWRRSADVVGLTSAWAELRGEHCHPAVHKPALLAFDTHFVTGEEK